MSHSSTQKSGAAQKHTMCAMVSDPNIGAVERPQAAFASDAL